MRQYNPVKLYLNMPVEYIELGDKDRVLKSGHFACYKNSIACVWANGKTSYTTPKSDIKSFVECEAVHPMTDNSMGVKNTSYAQETFYPTLAKGKS